MLRLNRITKGVEAGQQQEADLRGIGRREIDGAVPVLDPVQEHHQRPGQADEQPIGAGHVGGGVMHVLRLRAFEAGLVGVVEVDRVFRQHGHQGNDGQDQALRDVLLGGFRAPRQQEARRQDGAAEGGRIEDRTRPPARGAQDESGNDGRQGEGDQD